MLKADLLLRHGHLVTMDAERAIMPDGAIAIAGGRILKVGPDREIASRVEAAATRDLGGALVHPGLIDAHAHTAVDLVRNLLPESRDFGVVEYPFSSTRTPEEEYLSTLVACMEMVASGTTLYCDTGQSFSLDAMVEAIATVGMRGMPGYFLADERIPQDPNYDRYFSPTKTTEECLSKLEEQIRRYPFRGDGRVRCVATLQGSGTASDALLVGAKAIAAREGVPLITHLSWSMGEIEKCKAQTGKRPVEHFADLGLLCPELTLVHLIQVEAHEIDLVRRSGVSIVHCPAAAIRRGMGAIRLGRFPEMLKAGICVALGSDGWSSKHDVLRQAYLAANLFNEFRDEVPAITVETAFEMATVNGARALGMQDEVGSLAAGKRADIVVHRVDRPGPLIDDPVPHLIHYGQSHTVDTVFVDGEAILNEGRFTRFDAVATVKRLNAAATARARKIGAQRGTWPIRH
jgi:cytosine/adenosine deaminase-related metal-dependent hydrolase